jgi:hypothetical protein
MRINESDNDKLIMTRVSAPVVAGRAGDKPPARRRELRGPRVLQPSGITSAITIIINQIYRATRARNLLTRQEGKKARGKTVDKETGGGEGKKCAHLGASRG